MRLDFRDSMQPVKSAKPIYYQNLEPAPFSLSNTHNTTWGYTSFMYI